MSSPTSFTPSANASPNLTPTPKKKKWGRLILLCVIAFILFSITQFYQNHKRLMMMNDKVKQLQTNIEEMRTENERLNTTLKKMNSKEYIEKVAREELGLVKKGEILVITVDE
jgi:cell division protein FtsB